MYIKYLEHSTLSINITYNYYIFGTAVGTLTGTQ